MNGNRNGPIIATIVICAFIFVGFLFLGFLRFLLATPPMPVQQQQFLRIVEKYRDSYNAADDLVNSASHSRANEICQFFHGNLSVTGWAGWVKDFWRVSDGRVGLAVWLTTLDDTNPFTPLEAANPYVTLLSSQETLISPSDPLNKSILSFHRGWRLHFGGWLMASTEDCLQQASFTPGGTREPQWFFKFNLARPQGGPSPPGGGP